MNEWVNEWMNEWMMAQLHTKAIKSATKNQQKEHWQSNEQIQMFKVKWIISIYSIQITCKQTKGSP